MICVYIDNEQFLNEAKYVFRFLFAALGIVKFRFIAKPQDSGSILIYYGSEEVNLHKDTYQIQVAATNYYHNADDPKLSPAKKCVLAPDDLPTKIDFIFAGDMRGLENAWYEEEKSGSSLISVNEKSIHCRIDIIASSFYLLSLENERQTLERDDKGRFQKKFSKIGDEIYEQPLVDQFALLFESFLRHANGKYVRNTSQSLWPDNRAFALALSHDTDRLRSWTYSKAKRVLSRSNYKASLKKLPGLIRSISLRENWSGNFKYITELENEYYGNSTFFFASKQRASQDPKYELDWERIRKGLINIKERNCRIGLHGSIPSSENSDFLSEEKSLLEDVIDKPIIGLRQHYLRFDINKTFDVISRAGFKYDSTLGFSNDLGYRCGTSLPFHPFDPKNKRPYSFLEIPLILMDTVLFLEANLHLSSDEAWGIVEKYMDRAYKSGFCLTINWHNNNINIADVFGYGKLYEKVLNWAHERNAWICSTDNLYEWWNDKIRISNSGE